MKTIDKITRQNELKKIKLLPYSIFLIILIGFSSCTEDYWVIDGRPGNAYIALSWTEDEPEYIDAGTGAIPHVFYWNDYYFIRPGIYYLYYDGIYNDGYGYIDYAWEVEYEIYTNPGEYGTAFYDGRDGRDNYFTLDLNPYGPYVYIDYKSAPANANFKVLEEDETKIVILKEKEEYSLKITYRKTNRRNHE